MDSGVFLMERKVSMTLRSRSVAMLGCILMVATAGCQMPKTSAKLFYVNSYHPGEAASDELMQGLYEVIGDSHARLDVFFMDAQRFPETSSIRAKTEEVLRVIDRIQPDVIIASHETAATFVLTEYARNDLIPCVICGVDQKHMPSNDSTAESGVAVVGDVAASPWEQGRWAARMSLRLARGKRRARLRVGRRAGAMKG